VLVKYLPHNRFLTSSIVNTSAHSTSSIEASSTLSLKKIQSATNLHNAGELLRPQDDKHTPAWTPSYFHDDQDHSNNLSDDSQSDCNSASSFYDMPKRRYGFNNRMLSEDMVYQQFSPLNNDRSQPKIRFDSQNSASIPKELTHKSVEFQR